jgi:hypothetical protein
MTKSAWEKRAEKLCDKAHHDAMRQSREAGEEDSASVQQRTLQNLREQIAGLCRDLSRYEPKRDKNLLYLDLTCDDLECEVVVGVEYEPGAPGVHTMANGDPGYPDEPPSLHVSEVWLNGVDIGFVLEKPVCEQLTEAAWKEIHDLERSRIEDAADERSQARRESHAY